MMHFTWCSRAAGRFRSLRRDYGPRRVRSHGLEGQERDVGWGVVAVNLRQIARAHAGRVAQRTDGRRKLTLRSFN